MSNLNSYPHSITEDKKLSNLLGDETEKTESSYQATPGISYQATPGIMEFLSTNYSINPGKSVPLAQLAQGKVKSLSNKWIYTSPNALCPACSSLSLAKRKCEWVEDLSLICCATHSQEPVGTILPIDTGEEYRIGKIDVIWAFLFPADRQFKNTVDFEAWCKEVTETRLKSPIPGNLSRGDRHTATLRLAELFPPSEKALNELTRRLRPDGLNETAELTQRDLEGIFEVPCYGSPLPDDFPSNFPGVTTKGGKKTLTISAGVCVPCLGIDGNIQGHQVMVWDKSDGKYRWLKGDYSSHLAENGELPLTFQLSDSLENITELKLSEGILKPLIANRVLGLNWVGSSGGGFVGAIQQLRGAFAVLPNLKRLTLFLDLDDRKKPQVLKRLIKLFWFLKAEFPTLEVKFCESEVGDCDEIESLDYSVYSLAISSLQVALQGEGYLTPSKGKQFLMRQLESSVISLIKGQVNIIKSPKGSGKTQILLNIPKKIVITHRITLTKALGERLDLPTPYDERPTKSSDGGQALCVDSLHKLSGMDFTGYTVVFDEAKQVFEHLLTSPTCKEKRAEILLVLKEILRAVSAGGATVLGLDADADDFLCSLIQRFCPDVEFNKVENFPVVKEKQTIFTLDSSSALRGKLLESLREGQKVMLVHDGRESIEALCDLLKAEFPDKKIFAYDSHSAGDPEFKGLLETPDAWVLENSPDLLAASPSLVSGVSLNAPHFTEVFGEYNGVIAPNEARQAMWRVRYPVQRYLWANLRGLGAISTIGGLEETKEVERNLMYQSLVANLTELPRDNDDYPKLLEHLKNLLHTPEFEASLEVKVIKNMKQQCFRDQLYSELESMEKATLIPYLPLTKVDNSDVKAQKELNRQALLAEVLSLPMPDQERREELKKKKNQGGMSPIEHYELSRSDAEKRFPGFGSCPNLLYLYLFEYRQIAQLELMFGMDLVANHPKLATQALANKTKYLLEAIKKEEPLIWTDFRDQLAKAKILKKLDIPELLMRCSILSEEGLRVAIPLTLELSKELLNKIFPMRQVLKAEFGIVLKRTPTDQGKQASAKNIILKFMDSLGATKLPSEGYSLNFNFTQEQLDYVKSAYLRDRIQELRNLTESSENPSLILQTEVKKIEGEVIHEKPPKKPQSFTGKDSSDLSVDSRCLKQKAGINHTTTSLSKPFGSIESGGIGGEYLMVSEENLEEVLADLNRADTIYLDIETGGNAKGDALDHRKGWIKLIQLATDKSPIYIFDADTIKPTRLGLTLEGKTLIGQNIKFDLSFLQAAGGSIKGIKLWDTMIASYLLAGCQTGQNSLKAITKKYLGVELDKSEQASNWTLPGHTDAFLAYAATDVEVLRLIYPIMKAKVAQEGLERVLEIENQTVFATLAQETTGFHFNSDSAIQLIIKKGIEIQNLTKLIEKELGPLNIASPVQVKGALEKVGLSLPNTQEATLAEHSDLPVISNILAWKKLTKSVATIKSYMENLDQKTGRLHASLNQVGTATGRYSSSNPNLQNVAQDPEIRALFCAPPSYKICQADYSQIELRIVAELRSPIMLDVYLKGYDLHKTTAASLLNKPVKEVSKSERNIAKAVNFSLIYGTGWRALQALIKNDYKVELSDKEAQTYRKNFFKTYKDLEKVLDSFKVDESQGFEDFVYPRTPLGRKLSPTDYASKTNYLVQSTGADILKTALCYLVEALDGTGIKLVFSIHDEILLEAPEALVDKASSILKDCMERAAKQYLTKVPVPVDVKIIDNWSQK